MCRGKEAGEMKGVTLEANRKHLAVCCSESSPPNTCAVCPA